MGYLAGDSGGVCVCGVEVKWLSLFSGIGAYDLGLEQAGHEVIGFCENDPWARKILKKHWPTKPISWCVKSLRDAMVSSGGWPCQDISIAGKQKGIQRDSAGEATTRSGLIWTMVNIICLVRPRFVLLENVAAIFTRELGTVLGAMAECGYNTEWDCVGAGTVGAPHHRARAYILAHDGGSGGQKLFPKEIQRQPEFSWCQDVRRPEDLPRRSDLYPSKLCGGGVRVRERLHGIGNCNPPCIIRELTRGLK